MLIGRESRNYLVFWENVSPEATRVLLNKRLFGYNANGKFRQGAVQKFGCQRMGKGCISIPAGSMNFVLEIFKVLDVPIKMREVVDFGEKKSIEE